jgi:uncharacterized RDD family membrane protein YckC
MNTSFRHLLLSAAIAFFLTITFVALAQDPRPPETPVPPAPPAAPVPAVAEAAAVPATPAVEAEKPAEGAPPLRRLDVPTATEPGTKPKDPAVKRRRGEARSSQGGGEAPFGDHTVAKGNRTREAVSIMGATLVEGEVETDAVSVLGRTVIGPEGKVGGDAVAVLGRLESTGSIAKSAVSVLGGVDIDGPVGGEVVSVLGDMHFGPNAVVQGDIVLVGGKLTKDPKAIIRGNQVNVPFVGSVGDVSWFTTWVKRCVFLARPLAFGQHLGWAWLMAFSFLGFYALLALLFRSGIDKCVTTLETRPGMSVLAALLTVLLSPVMMVLLVATVVGLVLVPFVGIGLMLATLFGKAVVLAWLGRRFTRFFGDGPLGHPVVAVLVGGGLVMLLYTIPVFGFLLFKLLGWIGLGVVVLTLAQAMKREKPAVPPAPVDVGGPSGGEAPVASPFPPPMTPPATSFSPAPAVSPGFAGTSPAIAPEATPAPGAMGFAAGVNPFVSPVGPSAEAPLPLPPPPAAVPAFAPPPVALRPLPVAAASTLPRAGFMIRLGALALDAILVGMIVGFLSGMLPRVLQFNQGPGGVLLALAIYGSVMWKHKGTTIGGIVCGLKVVRLDNREIDWATAIVRALSCFLSLVVAGLGFIWVAFDDERQSWHDKIAGTTVVHVPKGVSLL